MPHTIFVSHSKEDALVAKAVTTVINDAFGGHIELYLAAEEIVGGDKWKQELMGNLKRSDAIITIMTPNSVRSPWIYVEWSPFWLGGKTYYALRTSDLELSRLISPMRDAQVVDLVNRAQVKGFFRALKSNSAAGIAVPFNYVDPFLEQVAAAHKTQLAQSSEASYGVFREDASLTDLPNTDNEKRKIAEYFYDRGEREPYLRIAQRIRHDVTKCDMALRVLDHGDLETAYAVSQGIRSTDEMATVTRGMIDRGHLDAKELNKLLADICGRNQTTLRQVAIHLAERDQEDSPPFRQICNLVTSMAVLRNIGMYLVANNHYESNAFDTIVKRLADINRAELRTVAIEFIRCGAQHSRQFKSIMNTLLATSPKNASAVMDHLSDQERELYVS